MVTIVVSHVIPYGVIAVHVISVTVHLVSDRIKLILFMDALFVRIGGMAVILATLMLVLVALLCCMRSMALAVLLIAVLFRTASPAELSLLKWFVNLVI